MRGRTTGAVAVAAALVLAASIAVMPSPPRASAAGRYRVTGERVAPGLRLLRIRDSRGPNRIRVLKLNLDSSLTLDMELANDEIPGHETTSSMAARNGAIAAINGDYTLLPSDPLQGRPVHMFAQNAELVTSPLLYGRNFALSHDEQTVYIGHPKYDAWLTQQETAETWEVAAWNEVPAEFGEFSVYTMTGGWNHKPPLNACSARLMPSGAPALRLEQTSVEQSFSVSAVVCRSRRLGRRGGTVISAPWGSAEGKQIKAGLTVGEQVTLGWTTGWRGVDETIGGNPTLLESGVMTAEDCNDSYFCDRNPRTGIGINANGKILLVTVDGRQERSVGMTPVEFARLFQYLGATSALNLDGGGSTTMWARGRVVNRYSGETERPVGSAILVVGEVPEPAPAPTISPAPEPTELGTSSADPVASRCDQLRDPASTGGLLDYLAKKNGTNTLFTGQLRRALEVYRGETGCESVRTGN
ncbi:MAG: phosphodiester glycosidase family protein [Actinomycetota bacterium]|nr:phosphodiester glycosidase family protein [Actinomycetota bacterium]